MSETSYKLVIKNASENSLAKIHKKINDTSVYQDIFFSKLDDSVSVPVRWISTSKTKNVYKTDNPYFTFETIEKHTHELNEYFTDKLERPHIKFIVSKEQQENKQSEEQSEKQSKELTDQVEEQEKLLKEQAQKEEEKRKLKKLKKEKLEQLEKQLEEVKLEKQRKKQQSKEETMRLLKEIKLNQRRAEKKEAANEAEEVDEN